MLTIILIAIILVASIAVFFKTNDYFFEHLSVAVGVVAFMAAIICLSICGNVKVNEDIDYQNTYYHKITLEYRLENIEKNNVGNEYLYNDIMEFNNSLRSTKKWANNPWTNLFNNQLIAELDYIELPYDN